MHPIGILKRAEYYLEVGHDEYWNSFFNVISDGAWGYNEYKTGYLANKEQIDKELADMGLRVKFARSYEGRAIYDAMYVIFEEI
jgi:hypothetical protein